MTSHEPGALDPLALQLVAALGESELVVALYDPQDVLRWSNAALARRFLHGVEQPFGFATCFATAIGISSG